MSFYHFISEHYELSPYVLPKQKPENDLLEKEEMEKLLHLISEKDHYEINRCIKERYGI